MRETLEGAREGQIVWLGLWGEDIVHPGAFCGQDKTHHCIFNWEQSKSHIHKRLSTHSTCWRHYCVEGGWELLDWDLVAIRVAASRTNRVRWLMWWCDRCDVCVAPRARHASPSLRSRFINRVAASAAERDATSLHRRTEDEQRLHNCIYTCSVHALGFSGWWCVKWKTFIFIGGRRRRRKDRESIMLRR